MTRWLPALLVLIVILLTSGRGLLAGEITSLVVLACGVGIVWWVSPLNGRSGARHRDTVTDDEGSVVIYWRPGCIYCIRLRGALGKDKGKATWVSIWADDEAAAFVRSVNDGNETVPTVRIGEQVHTNPEPEVVRAALR